MARLRQFIVKNILELHNWEISSDKPILAQQKEFDPPKERGWEWEEENFRYMNICVRKEKKND